MNKSAFYKGVLYELDKLAQSVAEETPQPTIRDAVDAASGVGALGSVSLAATKAIPPVASSALTSLANAVPSIAKPVNSVNNALRPVINYTSKISPIWRKGLGAFNGVSMLNDAATTDNENLANVGIMNPNAIRATQAVGGGLDLAANLLPGAARLVPGVARLVPGSQIATLGGLAGQLALARGSAAAENNSDKLQNFATVERDGVNQDLIPIVIKRMLSKNPEDIRVGMSEAKELLTDPKAISDIKDVTHPGFWARLGYDPTHLGMSSSGQPSTAAFEHALSRMKDQYNYLVEQNKFTDQPLKMP